MIFLKVLAALLAGVIGIFAGLLAVASSMASNSTDHDERRDATVTALWSIIVFALCAGAIVSLTGCASRYEGAGFTNTGKPAPRLCREVDKRGNEKWFNC